MLGHPRLRQILPYLLAVLLLCGSNSCSRRDWHELSERKLQNVLTDLYLARAVGQSAGISPSQADSVYQDVLRRHGVTQMDIDSTIFYLSASKANVLEKVALQAANSLSPQLALLERSVQHQFAPDGYMMGETQSYFLPQNDSISLLITPQQRAFLQFEAPQDSYSWQVALKDVPHCPPTIRSVMVSGLAYDLQTLSQDLRPWINVSVHRQDGKPSYRSESSTLQLPHNGPFEVYLQADQLMPTDTLSDKVLLPSDTITVTLYRNACSLSIGSATSLSIHDLRISAQ